MSYSIKILALLAVVITIEACGQCGNCAGALGRKKREAVSMSKVQDALLEFDLGLTEELSEELVNMTPAEKLNFIKDLSAMNNAVKTEIAKMGKNAKNDPEFLQKLNAKVARDFANRRWFKRLQSLAGEKIAKVLGLSQGEEDDESK